jgi:hypothetical protein
MGHATADWNNLTLYSSTAPVERMKYSISVRPTSTTGRLLTDLWNETGDVWMQVHLCPEPDSLACTSTDALALGMDPTLGWVCSTVGDSESPCESLADSPWVLDSWQVLTVDIELTEACGR